MTFFTRHPLEVSFPEFIISFLGYLAKDIKEVFYLKDPALFDPTRPQRKNPH